MYGFGKNNGFSLVEIIAASLIFSISAAGLFSVFSIQRESSEKSEHRLKAALLTRQLLEDLRAKVNPRNELAGPPLQWYDLVCDKNFYDWPYYPLATDLPNPQLQYACTEIKPPDPGAGSRQVTLRLRWDEPS